jgi:hypothetical protein
VVAPNPSTAHHIFDHVDWRVRSLAEVSLPTLLHRFAPHAAIRAAAPKSPAPG